MMAALAFVLPAALATRGFAVRRERDDDVPFLVALYATTRSDEMAFIETWSAAQKAAFVAQQFDAQRRDYRRRFPAGLFLLIERDAARVGRLYLDRHGGMIDIVDITLLPEQRGQGAGAALIEAVIAQAQAVACGVALHVDRFNPALRLYRRLGFVETGDAGVYLQLRRMPVAVPLS